MVDGEPHTRRVTKVAADALSIKDIIRLLRNDDAKTTRLKAILLRCDITDAEKLAEAAALV